MLDSLDVTAKTCLSFLGVSYVAGSAVMLSDVTIDIACGPPTLLLGPNGAGKTTWLKLAMGLLLPTTGTVVRGSPQIIPRTAFVFQKPVLLRRTAAANLGFALLAGGQKADAPTIDRLLADVGLKGLGNRPARRLSGGEQQRLAIARALARKPEVLFLDEPTASLDPASTKAIEDVIASVAARGVKVLMATHDLGEARRLAGDVIFLSRGRVIEHTPATRFFNHPETEEARRFIAGDLIL